MTVSLDFNTLKGKKRRDTEKENRAGTASVVFAFVAVDPKELPKHPKTKSSNGIRNLTGAEKSGAS